MTTKQQAPKKQDTKPLPAKVHVKEDTKAEAKVDVKVPGNGNIPETDKEPSKVSGLKKASVISEAAAKAGGHLDDCGFGAQTPALKMPKGEPKLNPHRAGTLRAIHYQNMVDYCEGKVKTYTGKAKYVAKWVEAGFFETK